MRRRKNRKLKVVFVLIAIVLIIGIFSTIFALLTATNSKIIANIKINNLPVSGLNISEAETKFESIIEGIMDDEIVLKHGDIEKTFTLKGMELKTNINEKIYEACNIGRNDSIITNNYKVLSVWINGENLEIGLNFNEEIMQSILSNLDENWEGKFVDNSYYIEGEKLIIVRGKEGIVMDTERFKEKN
ncbi:MAG: hypothetical protein HFJ50_02555 [Clostridia bacterium]|nr:hypothetical protein [Clostridia bacterium]